MLPQASAEFCPAHLINQVVCLPQNTTSFLYSADHRIVTLDAPSAVSWMNVRRQQPLLVSVDVGNHTAYHLHSSYRGAHRQVAVNGSEWLLEEALTCSSQPFGAGIKYLQ
jgi:hypothetical protein